MKKNVEEYESPYCDVCGHCGYIGCCGIRNFIAEHIEGKTNCKNESLVIDELISLCDYKDDVFEENKKLKHTIKEVYDILNNQFEAYLEPQDSLLIQKCKDLLKEVSK